MNKIENESRRLGVSSMFPSLARRCKHPAMWLIFLVLRLISGTVLIYEQNTDNIYL